VSDTPTVAVFDFDKTLSTRDNVLPFLAAATSRRAVARCLLASLPSVARGQRDEVKARLARLLTGTTEAELDDVVGPFVAETTARHLRPDVLARARWHAEQKHRLVVVSASFECYLAPIAERLGFDAALGTRLELVDGRLTGRLVGPNVRHAEKVRRLDEWLTEQDPERDGDRAATVWAYGDSSGDDELLARADHPIRVSRRRLESAGTEDRVAR
jgi:phosphatidylglycerophosphatase C